MKRLRICYSSFVDLLCVWFNDYEVRSEMFSYVFLFLQNVIVIVSCSEVFEHFEFYVPLFFSFISLMYSFHVCCV